MPDVTSGATLAVTNGNSTVTASSNIFNAWMAIGNTFAWLRIPHSSTDTQNGDNQWYQINSVESPTSLTLKNQYTGNTLSAASTFTIGQAPILPEDYQDLPMYRALELYYTTRFPDAVRAQLYHQKYEDGLAELNDEYGSKTTSVVLSDTEANIANANLFVRSVSEV